MIENRRLGFREIIFRGDAANYAEERKKYLLNTKYITNGKEWID